MMIFFVTFLLLFFVSMLSMFVFMPGEKENEEGKKRVEASEEGRKGSGQIHFQQGKG